MHTVLVHKVNNTVTLIHLKAYEPAAAISCLARVRQIY